MSTQEQEFAAAFNAHEGAENAALEAMYAFLDTQSVEALSVLCDPQWRWETRGWMSTAIIDYANEALNAKLDAMVQA